MTGEIENLSSCSLELCISFFPWEQSFQNLCPFLLKKEMATHSSILSWRIPWTEEPGGLYTVHEVAELDMNERLILSLCHK